MSKTQHLKSLERTVETLYKVTNDLTRENYELRQLLNDAIKANQSRDQQRTTRLGA